MLVDVPAALDQDQDLPGAVDLDRQISGVVAAVAVLSRVTTTVLVVISAAAGFQAAAFTSVPVAVAVYVLVVGWSAVFVMVVIRLDRVPDRVLTIDVAVTTVGVIILPWAARTPAFEDTIANPALEPVTVAVAVAVALISGSARRTVVSCATLAVGYGIGQAPAVDGITDVLSNASTVGWEIGTGACCYLLIRRLRAVARRVAVATEQVVLAREGVAARRAYADERIRQFQQQVLRYRALHDGPLRVLTAIAGPGPAGHPDPAVRRQCAVSANVLRGATPDDPAVTLTDLSLALVEAGNECAVLGLRVEYHFGSLPDHLPPDVVEAFSRASAEALTNVATHAGTGRARLTATATADRAVAVAVVDQGEGFDPAIVAAGRGIRHSIMDRMQEVGGQGLIDSHPGQGTRVDLRWPS